MGTFCEICIDNFLLPGFKVLANSLKYTCFGSNTAGWKHKNLQNGTPSQVFIKNFDKIFSNLRGFVRVCRNSYEVQNPLATNAQPHWPMCNALYQTVWPHSYILPNVLKLLPKFNLKMVQNKTKNNVTQCSPFWC